MKLFEVHKPEREAIEEIQSEAVQPSFFQRVGIEDDEDNKVAAQVAGVPDDHQPTVPDERQEIRTLPTTIETLPVVINKEVFAHAPVEPEWHQVKELSADLKSAIRSIGRQIFGAFTNTRVEDIQVLASLGGQGPNSDRELDAVAKWLKSKGDRDMDGERNFKRSIPDYDAQFQIHSAKNFTFMVVKDEFGSYIYSWPSKDNKY